MVFQSVNVLPVLPKPHNGPMGARGPALSAPEDKEMKKKLRNRESALAARERKKQKMLELERKVNELGKENDDLRNENSILKGTLSSVMKRYGAPNDEIEETLKIAQAKKNIKKEPVNDESSPKASDGQKQRTVARQQKVVNAGLSKKRDNSSVKQENTEPLIKLPKVTCTHSSATPIQFKNGQTGKMVKKLYIHNNQIILDSSKIFHGKPGLITTTATLNSEKTPTTNHMTSPTSSEQMIKQEPQDLPLRGRYSPPWTPPDMSMQNSPSSDSAYSTGSETPVTPQTGGQLTPAIQLYPIKFPEKRQAEPTKFSNSHVTTSKVHILDNEYESYDGETLYDTEIRYDVTNQLRTTNVSYDSVSRVPKYHAHHELIANPTNTGRNHQPDEPQEWINMLQNGSDVQFSEPNQTNVQPAILNSLPVENESLKPEDFLTKSDVKTENNYDVITSDNGSYTSSNSQNLSVFQSQILNIDDIFLDHI